MGPILILLHYFGLCFHFLKFGFWCDLALDDFCKFSKCIKFYVPKGANGVAGAGFSVRWSILLPHVCLHWQRKFLTLWCSQEIISLCI